MSHPTLDGIKEVIRTSMCLNREHAITDHCSLADELKVDSLDATDITMGLEQKYGCVIPDQVIKDMRTPAAMLNIVQRYIGTSSP